METAKLFTSGRSQAVRIPKKYRFKGTEVEIHRQGNSLVLTPISEEDKLQTSQEALLQAFLEMPCFPDFQIDREPAQKIQERELFFVV